MLITHVVHIVCVAYLTKLVPCHGPSFTIFSSDTHVSTLLYVCCLLVVIQNYVAGHSPCCGHLTVQGKQNSVLISVLPL
jgi:hypothetical protein